MKKAVLLSIQPKWCELIASGKKTLEVRKTRPKLKTPFKVYIYRTKSKDRLVEIVKDGDLNYGEIYHGKPVFIKANSRYHDYVRDGKVIGEFTCDTIYPISRKRPGGFAIDGVPEALSGQLARQSRLDFADLCKYFGDKNGFGWHISDFRLYDKPHELGEFSLNRPPQSWQYVEGER